MLLEAHPIDHSSDLYMPDFSDRVVAGFLAVVVLLVYLTREALKAFAQRTVAHEFDTRLESHKAELVKAAEGVRFDFSRKLRDVELFATKRHQVSAELFTAIRKADGAVRGLTGFRRVADMDRMDDEDLTAVMVSNEVAAPIQREIMGLLSSDRREGLKKLKDVLRIIEIANARSAFQEAYNLMLLSEIYMSDRVETAAMEVLKLLNAIIGDAEYPSTSRTFTDKDVVPAAIEALRVAIRAELGRGYFDDEPRRAE